MSDETLAGAVCDDAATVKPVPRWGRQFEIPPFSFEQALSLDGGKGCLRPTTMPTASGALPGAGGNEEAPSRVWGHNARCSVVRMLPRAVGWFGSFTGRRLFTLTEGQMRTFEQLESRWLPCTPLDVLEIVNTINAGQYTEQADVNQDGMVSPLDALLAINAANRRASIEQPVELHPQPNTGLSSISFSPCGESLSMLVMYRGAGDPELSWIEIGDEKFFPVEIGTLGKFHTIEFAVWGRGREWLRVFGDFSDELLTVIVG